MTAQSRKKKFFTPAEANSMLPLVRRIVGDITVLAQDLKRRHEQLVHTQAGTGVRQEELNQLEDDFENDKDRLSDLADELQRLGIQLKDPFMGLVDFPCWMDGREVYLCWREGEPDVAHWHELDAGFAGRQKLDTCQTI